LTGSVPTSSKIPTPPNFSRHYYDLAMLLETAEGKAASSDFDLLATVSKHTAVYFAKESR
jgi:hypothetical protein